MARSKLNKPNFVLRQDAKGFWVVRWTDIATGKTRSRSTETRDKPEAEARFGAIVATIEAPKTLAVVRVGPIIDEYLKAHPQERTSLQHVRERLGYLEPRQLNDSVARSYVDWRASQRDLSPATIRRDLEMLRAAMVWGTRNNLGYSEADVGKFKMPLGKPPARDRWLTREECRRLIHLGCKDTLHLRLAVRLMLAVGCRRTACLQLTWDRVTWPEGKQMGSTEASTRDSWPLRWVTDDVVGTEYEKLLSPIIFDFGRDVGKKRRVRHTPSGDNSGLYRDLRAAQEIAKSNHVIEWNGKPVTDIKTALNKAFRRAGIKDASGAHLLRHSCVTLMVMSGVSYEKVGRLVGMSARMVETTYGHYSAEYLAAAGAATAF